MEKPANKKPAVKKSASQYDPSRIESKWQKKWVSSKIYTSKEDAKKPKYYVLDMFPYPSGEGLHVGHPKGYIATDVVSRYRRMKGYSVLHPMGFDAFGLPAENYALKMKINPDIAVKKNVDHFKEQLHMLGFDYDWSREVNTTDPAYYKWTQWIFLQLFKKGLAYESYEPINWCPSCKTGLANEDVENGRCERCGTPVEKKPMRQWVLKITDYAERLLKDLDTPDPKNSASSTVDNSGAVPCFTQVLEPGAVRPDKPFVERNAIAAVVKHWKEDKFIGLKWKKVDWQTIITGGPEGNQTMEEAAIAEIVEETGYLHPKLIRKLGKVDTKFFHVPKDVNRYAHFDVMYFELQDDARKELSTEEKLIHDVVWVDRASMESFLSPMGQKYMWTNLFLGKKIDCASQSKTLLDWPASIVKLQKDWIGKSEGAQIDFKLRLADGKPNFVLIHGFEGSPKTNFFPWMKSELEKRGHKVEVPELPNSKYPKEDEQVDYVLKNCHLDENTVIVGHSLGSAVAMKVIMKLNKPVSGLVSVAAAIEPKFDKSRDSLPFWKTFNWNFDFDQIKKLTSGRIAVLSDTKEPFRMEYLKYLAQQLSSSLIETSSKEEHFCADQEPEVLQSVTPTVSVFTTRPDTLFGVTYIVLAPEHPWVSEFLAYVENRKEVEAYINRAKSETEIERTDATKEKTGVELKGVKAINPTNNEEVPVWISDYVLADYGTGAVMAVPAHDERDGAFAKKFGLPVKETVVAQLGKPLDNPAERFSARAIVVSGDKILLTYDKHMNECILPGGGVDAGENAEKAVLREIREETGYVNARIVSSLGTIQHNYFHQHRKNNWRGYATGFVVELKDQATDSRTDEEVEKTDFNWYSIAEAREKLKNSPTFTREVEFIDRYVDKRGIFFTEEGILINSGKFNGLSSAEAKPLIAKQFGVPKTTFKLRDWVFSRQRYWGEPIPLIHCEKCGVAAVPEKDLPVKLPKVKSYEPTGTGESPLAAISKWVNVKCPKCGGKGKRETNTMPQWAGSSWYYLRYEDAKDKKVLVDPVKEKYWSPVDLYVGGAEHATRHLIYARFWHKFLYDMGVVSTIEPFIKLQHVGLIMGEDGRKMSKRFGNIVNPDDVIKTFGADTMRVYEMFMGPFDQQIAWNTSSMVGSRRFIEKVWKLSEKVGVVEAENPAVVRTLHKAIKKVTDDIESLRFNTAISTLMIAVNELEKSPALSHDQFEILLKLLAPFAPHVVEELWTSLGNKGSIHTASWPEYDAKSASDLTARIGVQVNGKMRGGFEIAPDSTENDYKEAAQALPEIKKWTTGKEIKKVIVVKGKLVSIVTF